jgi:Carbohydrate esterase, sialic acid-specific acetylesterase
MKIITISLLVMSLALIPAPTTPVYVMMGQSNMYRMAPALRAARPDAVFINCAQSGSSIRQWQPGAALYARCLELTRAELAKGGRVLAGYLWFQGERDARLCTDAKVWRSLFVNAVESFADEIGRAPVRFARLGAQMVGYPCWALVRWHQGDLDRYEMVDTDSVPRLAGVHYDAAGYAALAQLFVGGVIH